MAERNCKKCFHYKACKEVASHSGYGDISYTESQCKHFLSTVDAVEVVRCRECRHYGGVVFGRTCRMFSGSHTRIEMPEDGYCSYGERR